MNELQVAHNETAIAAFGERDDIKELGERLRKLMPGTVKFTEEEALAVAQVALAHELDPFNGEVWGLKGDNNKWYGVMVGIKGLRKNARNQARREGGDFWISHKLVSGEKYNAPDDAIVYEAHLRDSVSFNAWMSVFVKMREAAKDVEGMTAEFIATMIGEAPVTVGIGVVKSGERSKMGFHQLAKKRAEADAIKQRYDVSFRGAKVDFEQLEAPINGYNNAIDGKVEEVEQKDKPRRETDEILAELGFATADDIVEGEAKEVEEDFSTFTTPPTNDELDQTDPFNG